MDCFVLTARRSRSRVMYLIIARLQESRCRWCQGKKYDWRRLMVCLWSTTCIHYNHVYDFTFDTIKNTTNKTAHGGINFKQIESLMWFSSKEICTHHDDSQVFWFAHVPGMGKEQFAIKTIRKPLVWVPDCQCLFYRYDTHPLSIRANLYAQFIKTWWPCTLDVPFLQLIQLQFLEIVYL